jgi:DNA-binding MarR family transcriptional regulator
MGRLGPIAEPRIADGPKLLSAETPWENLREAHFLLRVRFQQELGRFDMSVPDFMLLDRCGKGPARAAEVARALGLTAAGTTDALDRLEERRLVRRTVDPRDRRAVQVVLTPAGRRALKRAHSAKEATLRYLDRELSHDERRALTEGLVALTRALRRGTPGGA